MVYLSIYYDGLMVWLCVVQYYVCVQEVCHQYWPTSGVMHVEEFTVELLGEERLTGFIIRSFSLLHRKVG